MKFYSSQSTDQWLQSGIALLSLMGVLTTGMAASSTSATQPQAKPTTTTVVRQVGQQLAKQPAIPTRLPNQISQAVLQAHARQLGVPIRQLRIVSFSQESWSDTCLGLGRPEEGCGLATVNGWRVEVGQGTSRWFYRTDNTGQSLRMEEADNVGSIPSDVGRKVLDKAARDTGLSIEQLRIVAGRSQLWDGCLGVAGPNQPCTMIGIPGWQVIVAGPQQYWVYHLNQQGTLIKRNLTTSGKGTVVPSFWQLDAALVGKPSGEILFESVTSGGIAGVSYKTVLRRDGRVLRTDLRSPTPKAPTLVRRLTAKQVQTFVQTLQQNEFEDFLGFDYSSTNGADYFAIALIAPNRQQGTQYIDIAQDQTPPKLQRIIQAWNRIATPNR